MAEEGIEVPMTPERNIPKDGSLMKISTGRMSTSNNGEKVLPHYLRASTGSCHDFCKYGRKHAFEAKEKHLILKGVTATPDEGLNPIKNVSLVDRKKKPSVKPKPSPDPKTRVPGTLKIINREVSSPAKKTDVAAKTAIALKPKHVSVKLSPCSLNPSGDPTGKRNTDNKIDNNTGTPKIGKKKVQVLPKASLSSKPSFNRVVSLKTGKHRNLKIASLKNQNIVRKPEPELPNVENVREKVLYFIEPKTGSKSLGPAGNGIHTSLPSCSELPSSSVSPSSPPLLLREEEHVESDFILSKQTDSSLPLMSTLPSSSVSPSSPSLLLCEEEHVDSDFILSEETDSVSEYDETENENQVEISKEDFKGWSRRAAMIHPEDQDPARKLNFRRGKVVNPQSENNGPRKLKFRQGRVLGDNQNSKGGIRRRSFRKRELGDEDTNNTKDESEKVVLRHQDVNGKKDAPCLFNNVIEETASKLVETRKSKVKALVGAFETVICLQESKPSATSTI